MKHNVLREVAEFHYLNEGNSVADLLLSRKCDKQRISSSYHHERRNVPLTHKLSVTVSDKVKSRIDDYRFGHRIDKLQTAMVEIVEAGLRALGVIDDIDEPITAGVIVENDIPLE